MPKLEWLECADKQYHAYVNRKNTQDSAVWYCIDIEPNQFIAFFEQYDVNDNVIEQKEISFDSWEKAEEWCNSHASTLTDVDYFCWFTRIN